MMLEQNGLLNIVRVTGDMADRALGLFIENPPDPVTGPPTATGSIGTLIAANQNHALSDESDTAPGVLPWILGTRRIQGGQAFGYDGLGRPAPTFAKPQVQQLA